MPLMDNEQWKDVEAGGKFRRQEFRDDPMKLEMLLVYKVVNMRIDAGKPCVIHCAWANGKGHAPNSQHYLGKACDLRFPGMSLAEQVLLAAKHGFKGIGAYPGWTTPGIHVDVRDGKPAYWIEPADKKGTGQYVYYSGLAELVEALKDVA